MPTRFPRTLEHGRLPVGEGPRLRNLRKSGKGMRQDWRNLATLPGEEENGSLSAPAAPVARRNLNATLRSQAAASGSLLEPVPARCKASVSTCPESEIQNPSHAALHLHLLSTIPLETSA